MLDKRDVVAAAARSLASQDYDVILLRMTRVNGIAVESGFNTVQFRKCRRMADVVRDVLASGDPTIDRYVEEMLASYASALGSDKLLDSLVTPGDVFRDMHAHHYGLASFVPTHRQYVVSRVVRAWPEFVSQVVFELQYRAFSRLVGGGSASVASSSDLDVAGHDMVVCLVRGTDVHLLSISMATDTPKADEHYGGKVDDRHPRIAGLSTHRLRRSIRDASTVFGGVYLHPNSVVDEIDDRAEAVANSGESSLSLLSAAASGDGRVAEFLSVVRLALPPGDPVASLFASLYNPTR